LTSRGTQQIATQWIGTLAGNAKNGGWNEVEDWAAR